jgi:hypothetical protein
LELLRDPITKKIQREENAASTVSIANLGEIIFCYGAIANIYEKRQFFYDIESIALEKITLKEKFNTVNSTKFLWGLSKF